MDNDNIEPSTRADARDLSASGNPGPGTIATPENAQFPEGSGNPGPDLDTKEPTGAAQFPSGAGNPGPGNSEVTDPESSGSGNLGPNPDELEKPGPSAGPRLGGTTEPTVPLPGPPSFGLRSPR